MTKTKYSEFWAAVKQAEKEVAKFPKWKFIGLDFRCYKRKTKRIQIK
jgi:hypothetical protein